MANLPKITYDTFLALGVGHDYAVVVKDCLQHGGDPNYIKRSDGASLLHWAIENNNPEIVELLARAGASTETSWEGLTPLELARKLGYFACENAVLTAHFEDDGTRLCSSDPDERPGHPEKGLDDDPDETWPPIDPDQRVSREHDALRETLVLIKQIKG